MAVRNIVKIDENKCDGCGQCARACAEGAIAIVNGKAKVISETYCDGLGACIGDCPRGAITIEQREAPAFDPQAVKQHLAQDGAKIKAAADAVVEKLPCGCPGTLSRAIKPLKACPNEALQEAPISSELTNWPVQIKLVPVTAPYFNGAKLLISADCVPCAFGDFHRRFLNDHILMVGCPKLDDIQLYTDKLTEIFKQNDIKSVRIVYMEVPCCFGLLRAVNLALDASGKTIPFSAAKIGIRGNICEK
jgi:Pyruvate/2-oxoacid:ferredoxin oxidoreductase delta subunit